MSGFLTEARIIPPWARKEGLTRCFVYTGSSMRPTLRNGQLLYVRPAACDIVAGDVIVFVDPGRGCGVHRVISVTSTGLVTRGDNNPRSDPLPITSSRVIGRVEFLEGQDRVQPILGGRRGLWLARTGQGARRVGGWLRRLLRAPYRALRGSSLPRRVLGRWFSRRLEIVRLETPSGSLVKVLYRGKVVARWWPAANRFECQKPYDLVLCREDLR